MIIQNRNVIDKFSTQNISLFDTINKHKHCTPYSTTTGNTKQKHFFSFNILNSLWIFLKNGIMSNSNSWWRHVAETVSSLLALCGGNLSVTGRFPSQRAGRTGFRVPIDVNLNKRLNKPSSCRWWGSLWRHCNVNAIQWDNMICQAGIFLVFNVLSLLCCIQTEK